MKTNVASVGIDVAKKTLQVSFISCNYQELRQFKITNDRKGIKQIFSEMKKMKVSKSAPIVLESTSYYHLYAALRLSEQGYCVKEINPILTKKYAKGCIRQVKTDKVDAKILAEMGLREKLYDFKRSKTNVLLRNKVNLLQHLEKKLQGLQHSLNCARELQNTIDCQQEQEAMNIIEESIKNFKKSLNELKKEIVKAMENNEKFEKLRSIRGVSDTSLAKILTFIDGKEFASKSSLIAYTGLDLTVKESGSSIRGIRKLSKRGNSALRHTFSQCAWGLIMNNEDFRKIYDYYREQGRHYHECLIIIGRKLLKIIYGVLKNGSHFDPAKIVIPSKKNLASV